MTQEDIMIREKCFTRGHYNQGEIYNTWGHYDQEALLHVDIIIREKFTRGRYNQGELLQEDIMIRKRCYRRSLWSGSVVTGVHYDWWWFSPSRHTSRLAMASGTLVPAAINVIAIAVSGTPSVKPARRGQKHVSHNQPMDEGMKGAFVKEKVKVHV